MIRFHFERYPTAEVQHAPRSRVSWHGVYLVGPRWAYLFFWVHLRRVSK